MVIRDTADARETVDSQLQLFLLLEKVLNQFSVAFYCIYLSAISSLSM